MRGNACSTSHWVVSTDRALDGGLVFGLTVVTDGADLGLSHGLLITVEASNAICALILVVEWVISRCSTDHLCAGTF